MGGIIRHHRRSIRLPGYDYASIGDYFITIVTHHRQPFFGEIVNGEIKLSEMGEIVYRIWADTPFHFSNVEIGPFVIMPNHVHGIISIIDNNYFGTGRGTACCAPTPNEEQVFQNFGKLSPGSIPVMLRSFKSAVTHEIHELFLNNTPIWQRNYYEHIICSDEEYAQIAAYIEYNPENWMNDEENSNKF